jgi:tetratricopeptide (TPR) repeat protein
MIPRVGAHRERRRLVLPALAALVVAATALAPSPARADDVEVRATVDRNRVRVGDQFTLTIEIDGTQHASAPPLGNLGAFQAQYVGPLTQMRSVNGSVSLSVSHRYMVSALRQGRQQLGPFRVAVGGKTYDTDPITIDVVAANARTDDDSGPAPNKEISLRVETPKQSAYVGEQLPLTIKLLVGNARVDDLEYPQIASDGVVVDKLTEPKQHDEILNGRRYRVLEFTTTLTPLKPGRLTLGPITMGMSVVESRRNRRGEDPLFSQFFSFPQRRPLEVHARPLMLDIKPLPSEGRPANFSGAVGRFSFRASASPTEVTAGDPVTVHMEVRGHGNLGTMEPPRMRADDRFRTYDPIPLKDKVGPGTWAADQVVIPKDPKVHELPPVAFNFFDPVSGRYRTIKRGPFPLTVGAVAAAERPRVMMAEQPEAHAARKPEKLGRDIVYIKDRPGDLSARSDGHAGTTLFAVGQFAPVCAFLLLLAQARRRDRMAADPRSVRFRAAGRQARRRLSELERRAAGDGRLYDDLSEALRDYLAAKLDLPPGAVERARVLQELAAHGIATEAAGDVERFFDLVERTRYARRGGNGVSDHRQALAAANAIVKRLERNRQLAKTLGIAALALLLASAVALPSTATADSPTGGARKIAAASANDPYTGFFQGNAAYKGGDYPHAIEAYQQVLAAGLHSGALYYNLGNAYFKNDQTGMAILEYERAERLLPRDPDLRANLAYAREVAGDDGGGAPLWRRIAFPLADRATTTELAVVATALWWMLWSLLAARLFLARHRLVLGRTAIAVGVAFAIVASSLAWRGYAIEWRDAAVVTANGGGTVRYEPTESGTEYFKVAEGAVLDITAEREDWVQIRRRDGRRGWIPAAVLTRI